MEGERAGREQHKGPDRGGYEIGELEQELRQPHDPGQKRHDGAQRPQKTAEENAPRPPAAEKELSVFHHLGMARQWPDMQHAVAVSPAEPVGQPVAHKRAEGCGKPKAEEIQPRHADQCANADQDGRGRHEQRKEGEGFAESQNEGDERRPCAVVAHESQNGLKQIA